MLVDDQARVTMRRYRPLHWRKEPVAAGWASVHRLAETEVGTTDHTGPDKSTGACRVSRASLHVVRSEPAKCGRAAASTGPRFVQSFQCRRASSLSLPGGRTWIHAPTRTIGATRMRKAL